MYIYFVYEWEGSEYFLSHYIVEVFASDLLAVAAGPLEHFLEFFETHGLPEFLGDSLEVVHVDALAHVVVEEVEDLVDAVLGLLVAELVGDGVQELLEVDFAVEVLEFGDHLVDGGVLVLEAQGLHGGAEFLGVDLAGAVGVEEVEGLPDLFDLVLGEAGSLDGLLALQLVLTAHDILFIL